MPWVRHPLPQLTYCIRSMKVSATHEYAGNGCIAPVFTVSSICSSTICVCGPVSFIGREPEGTACAVARVQGCCRGHFCLPKESLATSHHHTCVAYSAGKTLTAPLDRVKLLLQTRGGLQAGALKEAARGGGVIGALAAIGKEEGFLGYWKGNVPQVR